MTAGELLEGWKLYVKQVRQQQKQAEDADAWARAADCKAVADRTERYILRLDLRLNPPLQELLTEKVAQLAKPCGCKTCLGCRAWAELQYRKG